MASFDDLKKASKVKIEDLVNKAEQQTSKKSYIDDRFWKPTRDKSGNGYAVIRFLPAPDQPTPWVQYFDHFFKGPTGRWYVEKSLTSIGQNDPLAERNAALWNREGTESAVKANQEVVRSRKRKLHYVTNIQVIKDSANPENDGKVLLYDFGAKIFAKIMNAMQPEFPDQEPFNPFDLWGGANFSLRIRKVEGYPNYDESSFGSPSEHLGGDEEKLKAVYEMCHPIGEFVDPSTFKSYDELNAKLDQVLGTGKAGGPESQSAPSVKSEDSRPTFTEKESVAVPDEDASMDEDLSFFDQAIDDD